MEVQTNGHIPFQGPDVHKRSDGSSGHTVYRKPTQTDLHLNAKSHHHPENKMAVHSNLADRAKAICVIL
jgi:hypothetical protein